MRNVQSNCRMITSSHRDEIATYRVRESIVPCVEAGLEVGHDAHIRYWGEPHTNHTYEKIAVPMYVCMYVARYVVHVFIMHYACACARISQFVNVDCMLTLIVAHPAGELNSSMNSQRVRAGKDLENSLLKGRRSRLYKQHTSLQCYYDHSLYHESLTVLRCWVELETTVLNLYWTLCLHVQHSATDCC